MRLLPIIPVIFMIFLVQHSLQSQEKIGIFDNHLDIGACKNQGFASYDPEDQTYRIGGSGTNMWFDKDEFHYLWTTLQGDFILRAEVEFMGGGVDPHRASRRRSLPSRLRRCRRRVGSPRNDAVGERRRPRCELPTELEVRQRGFPDDRGHGRVHGPGDRTRSGGRAPGDGPRGGRSE